ncbi:hypothetical protein BDZ90DRAFT_234292 [Jaminaea rosea]|uniref:Uncharacterized protein n=1 Tax=Jaminaea rosea TaxID=1569628 RepID=A0A316UJH1_9BASI|nr:hypothetical protein BDZ90DRAFT_234292 [Jaminaea rosea]PWN25074.1 hypothetical protein BDZ90DRAFT_234292 [Jaminaea rosea]
MSSEEGFRLRTKDDPIGSISIPKLIRSSVRHGEFQFMFLVPHFVLPAYGIYRLAHSQGIYPAHLEPLAEVVLAVVQGVAVGGLITFGWLRFSAAGRRLQGRIEAGAATPGEAKAQKKMQLGFALCAYVLFATTLWLVLPPADGPKTAAMKKTARRYGLKAENIPSFS